MSVSYNDGVALAKVSLREDGNRLKPADWMLIAQQATLHYSKDRPRQMVADITGNGTKSYNLTSSVTRWKNRFSFIQTLEFPVGNDPITFLQTDNYRIYKTATDVETLVLKNSAPSASKTMRINYTSYHQFDDTTSTIDDQEKVAFCLLMGFYAAMALISDFLKANRSNLPNDSVDYSQKSRDMQILADSLFKKYSELVTGKSESVKCYSTYIKDFDMLGRYRNKYYTVPEDSR